MKFFIPGLENDPQKAEELYKIIRDWCSKEPPWVVSDRRIFRIEYRHGGKELYAQVGELEPIIRETVWAILDSLTYLVCTTNRGVKGGEPIMVGKDQTNLVQDFEM